MRKSILFSTTAFLLLTVYSSFMETASYAEGNRKTITGQVTLVGDRILKIKEDGTQFEYLLQSEPEKLVDIITGYRVEVEASEGHVSSISILGVPMKAEPESFQKWTVITRPSE